MAKINVEFDTASQMFDVSIDGNTMKNVHSVDIFKEQVEMFSGEKKDMFMAKVVTRESVDDDKVERREMTTFVSKASNEAKIALLGGNGVEEYDGLIKITKQLDLLDEQDDEVLEQVKEYFGVV